MASPTNASRPHRILLPIDFSDCSSRAFQVADSLAAKWKADLSLLHVIEPCLPTGNLPLDLARMRIDFRKEAQSQLDEVVKRSPLVSRAVVCAGSPAREILREAAEIGADLIVIGTHGRTGFPHLLIGSVAERVLRLAPCPVLVVPLKGVESLKMAKVRMVRTKRSRSGRARRVEDSTAQHR